MGNVEYVVSEIQGQTANANVRGARSAQCVSLVNNDLAISYHILEIGPSKFSFVHQTVSCQEVYIGWA